MTIVLLPRFYHILSFVVGCVGVFVSLVVRHKQKNPEKSYTIAVLNTIFIPFRLLKMGIFDDRKITLEGAMKIAMKDTKLTDFGDMTFVERYKKIAHHPAVKNEQFSNLGYLLAASEWEMMARRRLLLVEFIKKHPEVTKIPIKEPLFIFGLGRSGTTFVHRLLSLNPNCRSPALWELAQPCPEVDDPALFPADRQKRLDFIKKRIASRNVMGDSGLEQFHEIGAELPEECLFGLSDEIPTIFHYVPQILIHLEYFDSQVTPKDITAAYEWYKKLLQVLMYQTGDLKGEKRWVLKCPLHILWIKELAKAFPDAKLVWAHRHPSPTVTSLCALVRAMHHNYYEKDKFDPNYLGKELSSVAGRLLNRVESDLQIAKLPCADVLFENLTTKPFDTVKAVYQQFGWEYTPEYHSALEKYLEENRKQREETRKKMEKMNKNLKGQKDKLHDFKPEDFGLTKSYLSNGPFQQYIQRYHIQSDK